MIDHQNIKMQAALRGKKRNHISLRKSTRATGKKNKVGIYDLVAEDCHNVISRLQLARSVVTLASLPTVVRLALTVTVIVTRLLGCSLIVR